MKDRREFRRIQYREPVRFVRKGQAGFGGSLSRDLSTGGLQFRTFDFLALREDVQLSFSTSDERQVSVNGRVAWIQQLPETDSYHVGVAFDADPSTRQAIADFVENRIEQS